MLDVEKKWMSDKIVLLVWMKNCADLYNSQGKISPNVKILSAGKSKGVFS